MNYVCRGERLPKEFRSDEVTATTDIGALRPEGLLWIGLGFGLTLVPTVLVGFFAFKIMKIDFGSVSGMLCGSMANPMALNYANDTIPGDNPSVAYATVYPLSMFLRVIIAQVLLMFLL